MAKPSGYYVLAFTGDWHTNSSVGLNPPVFHREMESKYMPGKVGRAVWRNWRDFWKVVDGKKKQYRARLISFCNGDLGDKNKHSAVQLISNNDTEIQDAMAAVADVPASISDDVFVIRGTAAHTGDNGKLEEWLAQDLDNSVWYGDKVASWWMADPVIAGLRLLVAHHPPTSSKVPWTLDQAVSRAASQVAVRCMEDGAPVPDVCVWSHTHPPRLAQGRGLMGVWGFFLPPWQLRTGYSYRIGQSFGRPAIGGLWMVVKNGSVVEWEAEHFRPGGRRPWIAP